MACEDFKIIDRDVLKVRKEKNSLFYLKGENKSDHNELFNAVFLSF